MTFNVSPIGYVNSTLQDRLNAPRQGWLGAPDARLQILPEFHDCLEGMQTGQQIWILTWLHRAERSTLKVHPGKDPQNLLTGVFATRSPDRPNPIGLHRTRVLKMDGDGCLHVEGLEAIDGTPILDIKPVLEGPADL